MTLLNAQSATRIRPGSAKWRLTDLTPRIGDLLADALAGLSETPKRLSSKYFYDARGSELFEAITRQPEYYVTRTETALLRAVLPELARTLGPRLHVVELGTGSGTKTRLLLAALDRPVAYTAIEISEEALVEAADGLSRDFPEIEILPVCADFTQPVPLPEAERAAMRTLVFFPGSTLGNFYEDEAVELLSSMRQTMGPEGRALIGIDLVKDAATIEAAYNDAAGVTAAFTLNLLARLNAELGADFNQSAFYHQAVYSSERERIETSIVSGQAQTVTLQGKRFNFRPGEEMQVEISQKYTEKSFSALARSAGLSVDAMWKDDGCAFALALVRACGGQIQ
jgi:L-histidine N-alpha-methyltransferase